MFEHAKQLLKDSSVASLAPTTDHCVEKIAAYIDFDSARTIIEYGPGDGALTSYIIAKMRPDARLILIETNNDFVAALNKNFRDPRVTIVHESAANIERIKGELNITKVDYIVSGIPFSMIPHHVKENIIAESKNCLDCSGRFIVYQALTAIGAKKSLKDLMSNYFEIIDNKPLIFNLPPLYVIEAKPR